MNCPWCGGYYLKSMKSLNPKRLKLFKGKTSVLISGGYDKQGKLPWREHLSFLKKIRRQGLKINLHPGICEKEDIEPLKELSPVISFDFITDDDLLEEAGFSVQKKDFLSSFELLQAQKIRVIPHLLVGRNRGKIKTEYEGLKILADYSLKKLVFLIFIPAPGTAFSAFSPPSLSELEKFFFFAREALPRTDFYLGCMRPRGFGREKIEELAIKYQFVKIVMPAKRTQKQMKENNFRIKEQKECCAFDSGNSRDRGGSGT